MAAAVAWKVVFNGSAIWLGGRFEQDPNRIIPRRFLSARCKVPTFYLSQLTRGVLNKEV